MSRLIALGTTFLALLLPPAATAGTFGWSQPGDFNSAGAPANPDHDPYGALPWRYVEGPRCATPCLAGHGHAPSGFTLLSTYDRSRRGWSDPTDPGALWAVGSNASQLFVSVPSDRVVALGWRSPLPHRSTVYVVGRVAPAAPSACYTWSLEQGGVPLRGQSGAGSGTITTFASVAPGGSLYLVIHPTDPLVPGAGCATAHVALGIAARQNLRPAVSLSTPAPGSFLSRSRPSFSGLAGTGYGTSPQVTVRLYRGVSTTGAPARTLSAIRTAEGAYRATPPSPLADGTYTAQVEQDDRANPPDRGHSRPITFTIYTTRPTLRLEPPARQPFLTATPALSGVAGTARGDGHAVAVLVYSGPSTSGSPVGYAQGPVLGRGRFSAVITRGLPDGRYTAVAVQHTPRGYGFSQRLAFSIKRHPPAVSIAVPAADASTAVRRPLLGGVAGHALGDSDRVAVELHAGVSASGRSLGGARVQVARGFWWLRWPRRLAPGLYTESVSQLDGAGHRAEATRTFLIVRSPTAVGALVRLGPQDIASVPVTCLAPSGQVCRGTVLVLSLARLRTLPGGPVGHVRVLFASVAIPGGRRQLVRRRLPDYVAAALRRAPDARVQVDAALSGAGRFTAIRLLVRRQ